jgi:hypothetical protein
MKGLDDLSKKLKEFEKFISEIDGEIGTVNFDPFDAESIEQAIIKMEKMIDDKSTVYYRNQMIQDISVEMKEKYRQAIIDKAANSRLQAEDE